MHILVVGLQTDWTIMPCGTESVRVCWLEAWAKAHGTHNASLFPAGEDALPRSEKEYLLDVGIGEALMQGCFDAHITGEIASFFEMTFDAVVLGSPLRLEISIKGWEEERIFYGNDFLWVL